MQKKPDNFTFFSRRSVKQAARNGGLGWQIAGAVILIAIMKAILSQ